MRTNSLFLLGVSLLFLSLISPSLSSSCAILAGKDGSDTVGGSIPSSDGFRHGASLNLATGSQITPHYLASSEFGSIATAVDYFLFTSPTENKIKKLSFDGEVETFAGSGTAGSNNDVGTAAQFYSPMGINSCFGTSYIADYWNMQIRGIDIKGTVSTVFDFYLQLYPSAVYCGSPYLYVLGNTYAGGSQSIAALDYNGNLVIGPLTSLTPGECSSITQDGASPFNVYFGCTSTIKKYDSSLNFISDYTTSFTNIVNLFMDPNVAYPAPLYVVDSAENLVYSFDVSNDAKTEVAGVSGAYDGSSDVYGVTDCGDVSFNTPLSVATTNAGNLVILTTTDIYIQVPSSPSTYPNVIPIASNIEVNPLPNLLTLDFNSYNATASTLSTTLDFHPEYVAFASIMGADFVLADFILHWWEDGSSDVQGITLAGDQTFTLDYDFTDFVSGNVYFIELQYRTSTGISSDTTYEFGPQTRLISGPQDTALWAGQASDGSGSNAQYNPTIDHITFDPVSSLFYFADSDSFVIRSISLSDGTETTVAGDPTDPDLVDSQGLAARFFFPLNAVFDTFNRLLYVLDGGDTTSLATNIRSIDVDNSYNVQTLSITGFSAPTIYAITVDNVGNLYVYGSDYNWYYITKSGSTYTVANSVSDSIFTSAGTSEVYWTQGDICENSGVSSCLVVQNTQIDSTISASYGAIYTVETTTFTATELPLGNYVFNNIGVSQTGDLFVYSIVMGFGKYLLDQNTIAWLGGDRLSLDYYLFNAFSGNLDPDFDINTDFFTESYSNVTAAFAQYDQGHGPEVTYPEPVFYPITFDNNGNVYLFDAYNFRQFSLVVGTTATTTTTSGATTTTTTTSTTTSTTTGTTTGNPAPAPICHSLKTVKKRDSPILYTYAQLCNYTVTHGGHFIRTDSVLPGSTGDKGTVEILANGGMLMLTLYQNHSGLTSWSFDISTQDGNFTITTQLNITDTDPIPKHVNISYTAANGVPNLNVLINSTDPDGDTIYLHSISCLASSNSKCVQMSTTSLALGKPANVFVQAASNGDITLTNLSLDLNGNFTAGSPIDNSWGHHIAFQYSVWDGNLDKLAYPWRIVDIYALH